MHIASPFSGLDEIVTERAPLAPLTWFKLGGPARWVIQPRTPEELQLAAQRASDSGIAIYILGLGANLLVGDAGVDGAVFRLSQEHWRTVKFLPDGVEVGAGVDMQKLLLRSVRQGLAGLEPLTGIPGTIGGGIRMNAGGKFGDIGGTVRSVTVMDSGGMIFDRLREDLVFDYRTTNIAAPFILGATLNLEEEAPETVMRKVREIWMYKQSSQPLGTRNAGSVFKNPRGLSAGALIDQAGLKGLSVGGAEISTKHANFIIANKGATADDVLRLISAVREKVLRDRGILLETEVQVWGA